MFLVDRTGFEPVTFCMPCRRATSCANGPGRPKGYYKTAGFSRAIRKSRRGGMRGARGLALARMPDALNELHGGGVAFLAANSVARIRSMLVIFRMQELEVRARERIFQSEIF